jgi:hypothetical protein
MIRVANSPAISSRESGICPAGVLGGGDGDEGAGEHGKGDPLTWEQASVGVLAIRRWRPRSLLTWLQHRARPHNLL